MIIIRRTSDSEYRLEIKNGDEIQAYQTSEMKHPDDWIEDAREAGETVSGPYDWQYIDDRSTI
jgi:hypothetical protein